MLKKVLKCGCLLLAVMMLTACGGQTPDAEVNEPETIPVFETVANPITYFSLSVMEDPENYRGMNVFDNGDGMAYVEYVADVKKADKFDPNVFHGLTEAFAQSGLPELSGKDNYAEGEASASMYVEFADGTMAAVGFSGIIPEEFTKGYGEMEEFFKLLTAPLPVYVPQPMVMGEVEQPLLDAILEILKNSGIETLDAFTVSQVAKDEYFAFTVGLSDDKGITSAVSSAPMMITDPYSLVIVTLEDEKTADAVRADFEKNVDWRKWVCVAPSNAVTAQKGNMVLCLIADGEVFAKTLAGINAAGWSVGETLDNPDK